MIGSCEPVHLSVHDQPRLETRSFLEEEPVEDQFVPASEGLLRRARVGEEHDLRTTPELLL